MSGALASEARAETPGEKVMRIMDETLTAGDDQMFEFLMVTKEKGKPDRKLLFEVTIKGSDWRRVELVAPGDVKGMRYLVRSITQSYVYLPAYNKIRRVASHVRDVSFMGSAMNQDDMNITTYGDKLLGELISEDDKTWKLVATQRPDQDFPYPKLELVVSKEFKQPLVIKYFNDKGQHIKTETREDYECKDGFCHPKLMTMVDHRRNDISSAMHCRKWKVNAGVPDSFFTVRSLQRRGRR